VRRRHKAALAVAHVLVPLAACGPATVAAPTARDATSTTSPEAEPPTSVVVVPETEAASPQPAATGPGPTTVVESLPGPDALTRPGGYGGAESPPGFGTGQGPASNSIANGPLPVAANSGIASWYDAAPRTTASRDYPRGTRLQVCRGAACVLVTVADFGPELWTGRSLDLSADSFAELAPLSRGVVDVTWGVVA
jgi:rare lipoprotein A (peptidoglycan hydrolase)